MAIKRQYLHITELAGLCIGYPSSGSGESMTRKESFAIISVLHCVHIHIQNHLGTTPTSDHLNRVSTFPPQDPVTNLASAPD